MNLNLNDKELNILWSALNDREYVLAGDYERAVSAKSWALANQIGMDLQDLRLFAGTIQRAIEKT